MKSIKTTGMALALALLISPMCSYASENADKPESRRFPRLKAFVKRNKDKMERRWKKFKGENPDGESPDGESPDGKNSDGESPDGESPNEENSDSVNVLEEEIGNDKKNVITRTVMACIAAVGTCCKTAYDHKKTSIVVGAAVVAGSYYLYKNYKEIAAYALFMKLRLQEKFAAKKAIEEGVEVVENESADAKGAEDKN